jgi:hypothetical protein
MLRNCRYFLSKFAVTAMGAAELAVAHSMVICYSFGHHRKILKMGLFAPQTRHFDRFQK